MLLRIKNTFIVCDKENNRFVCLKNQFVTEKRGKNFFFFRYLSIISR